MLLRLGPGVPLQKLTDFVVCRSVIRLLRKKLVKLPKIEPPPDQADISPDLRKVLHHATKAMKKNNDAYLGVDTLLTALLDNKDVQAALDEAGTLFLV